MPNTMPQRSLEIIGRNVVAIREQCSAILLALSDVQDACDERDAAADSVGADRDAARDSANNPDAPAGAPRLPAASSRVFGRGDIRTTPSGERVIRPTFGKPDGEPLPSDKQSTEGVQQ